MKFEDECREVRAEYMAMFPKHLILVTSSQYGWTVDVRDYITDKHGSKSVGTYHTPYRQVRVDLDGFEQSIYMYVDTEVFTDEGDALANLKINPMYVDDVRAIIQRLEKLIEGM